MGERLDNLTEGIILLVTRADVKVNNLVQGTKRAIYDEFGFEYDIKPDIDDGLKFYCVRK